MNLIVVTEVSVKVSRLPKYVQPIYDELCNAECYAFESEEAFDQYLVDLQKWVREINESKGSCLYLGHYPFVLNSNSHRFGVIRIDRRLNKGCVEFFRLTYLRLQGHIVVGLDGRTLRKFPFFKKEVE